MRENTDTILENQFWSVNHTLVARISKLSSKTSHVGGGVQGKNNL